MPNSGGRPSMIWASTSRFTASVSAPVEEVLPWDHIHIKYGRDYLAKEQNRSIVQLESMAGAV